MLKQIHTATYPSAQSRRRGGIADGEVEELLSSLAAEEEEDGGDA